GDLKCFVARLESEPGIILTGNRLVDHRCGVRQQLSHQLFILFCLVHHNAGFLPHTLSAFPGLTLRVDSFSQRLTYSDRPNSEFLEQVFKRYRNYSWIVTTHPINPDSVLSASRKNAMRSSKIL